MLNRSNAESLSVPHPILVARMHGAGSWITLLEGQKSTQLVEEIDISAAEVSRRGQEAESWQLASRGCQRLCDVDAPQESEMSPPGVTYARESNECAPEWYPTRTSDLSLGMLGCF